MVRALLAAAFISCAASFIVIGHAPKHISVASLLKPSTKKALITLMGIDNLIYHYQEDSTSSLTDSREDYFQFAPIEVAGLRAYATVKYRADSMLMTVLNFPIPDTMKIERGQSRSLFHLKSTATDFNNLRIYLEKELGPPSKLKDSTAIVYELGKRGPFLLATRVDSSINMLVIPKLD